MVGYSSHTSSGGYTPKMVNGPQGMSPGSGKRPASAADMRAGQALNSTKSYREVRVEAELAKEKLSLTETRLREALEENASLLQALAREELEKQQASGKAKSLSKSVKDRDGSLKTLSKTLDATKAAMEVIEQENRDLQARLKDAKMSRISVQQENESKDEELAKTQENMRLYAHEVERLQTANASLQARMKDREQQTIQAHGALSDIRSRLREAEEHSSTLQRKLNAMEDKAMLTAQQYSDESAARSTAEAIARDSEQSLRDIRSRVSNALGEAELMAKEKLQLEREKEQLQSDISRLERSRAELRHEVSSIQDVAGTLRDEITSHEKAKKRLLDQIGDMKDDMHNLRESLERTEQLVSEKESNFERERSARLQIETESERAMQRIKSLHESAVQDKDKVIQTLRNELEQQRNDCSQLHATIRSLKSEASSGDSERTSLQDKLNTMKTEAHDLRHELQRRDEECRIERDRFDSRIEEERQAFRSDKESLLEEIDRHRGTISSLHERVAGLEHTVSTQKRAAADVLEENKSLQQALKTAQDMHRQSQQEIDESGEKMRQLHTNFLQLQHSLSTSKSEASSSKSTASKATSAMKVMRDRVSELESDLEAVKRSKEELRLRLESESKSSSESKKNLRGTEDELLRAQHRIRQLTIDLDREKDARIRAEISNRRVAGQSLTKAWLGPPDELGTSTMGDLPLTSSRGAPQAPAQSSTNFSDSDFVHTLNAERNHNRVANGDSYGMLARHAKTEGPDGQARLTRADKYSLLHRDVALLDAMQ